jgi:hypothetical protein
VYCPDHSAERARRARHTDPFALPA